MSAKARKSLSVTGGRGGEGYSERNEIHDVRSIHFFSLPLCWAGVQPLPIESIRRETRDNFTLQRLSLKLSTTIFSNSSK